MALTHHVCGLSHGNDAGRTSSSASVIISLSLSMSRSPAVVSAPRAMSCARGFGSSKNAKRDVRPFRPRWSKASGAASRNRSTLTAFLEDKRRAQPGRDRGVLEFTPRADATSRKSGNIRSTNSVSTGRSLYLREHSARRYDGRRSNPRRAPGLRRACRSGYRSAVSVTTPAHRSFFTASATRVAHDDPSVDRGREQFEIGTMKNKPGPSRLRNLPSSAPPPLPLVSDLDRPGDDRGDDEARHRDETLATALGLAQVRIGKPQASHEDYR